MEESKHLPAVCDKLTKELLADVGYNHDERDSWYEVTIIKSTSENILVSGRRPPFLSNVSNPVSRNLTS